MKINIITNCLYPGVDKYLFIDDFCITSTCNYIRTAEYQQQQDINKINKWAMINGFKISKTKTQSALWLHFQSPTAKLIWAERKDHKIIRSSHETHTWRHRHFNHKHSFIDLNKLPKNKTHPLTYQEKLNNIQVRYPNHLHIFMDGSKSNNGTRSGAALHKKTLKKRLLKEAPIFSAEICAINLAFKLVSTSNKGHSDSIFVLQSLKNIKLDNPFIVKFLNKLNSMNHSKKVIFCWIPSYIGIQGNDKADSLVKAALIVVPDKKSKIPLTDLKLKIRQIITKKW